VKIYANTGKEMIIPSPPALRAFKSADTSRTSTTATSDPDLVLTLQSKTTYAIMMFANVTGTSGSSIKYTWGGSCTAFNFVAINPIWNTQFLGFTIPFVTSFGAAATQNSGSQNNNNMLEAWGSIEVDAGGTFSYQWAQ
jgi:hypothetical protein